MHGLCYPRHTRKPKPAKRPDNHIINTACVGGVPEKANS